MCTTGGRSATCRFFSCAFWVRISSCTASRQCDTSASAHHPLALCELLLLRLGVWPRRLAHGRRQVHVPQRLASAGTNVATKLSGFIIHSSRAHAFRRNGSIALRIAYVATHSGNRPNSIPSCSACAQCGVITASLPNFRSIASATDAADGTYVINTETMA